MDFLTTVYPFSSRSAAILRHYAARFRRIALLPGERRDWRSAEGAGKLDGFGVVLSGTLDIAAFFEEAHLTVRPVSSSQMFI